MRHLISGALAAVMLAVPTAWASGATQQTSGCGTSVSEDHEDIAVAAEDFWTRHRQRPTA